MAVSPGAADQLRSVHGGGPACGSHQNHIAFVARPRAAPRARARAEGRDASFRLWMFVRARAHRELIADLPALAIRVELRSGRDHEWSPGRLSVRGEHVWIGLAGTRRP